MNTIQFAGECSKSFEVQWHTHEHWELVYCTGGGGTFKFKNGMVLPYREGDTVAIPPGERHANLSQEGFSNIHVQMADPAFPQDAPQLGADVHAGPSCGLVDDQDTAGHGLFRRTVSGIGGPGFGPVLTGSVIRRFLLLGGVQGLQRVNVGGIQRPDVNAVQGLAADHAAQGGLHLDIEILVQMVLRQSAQMVFGQLLPQKDVIAVIALHDAADLAGLEGEGGVLELLVSGSMR